MWLEDFIDAILGSTFDLEIIDELETETCFILYSIYRHEFSKQPGKERMAGQEEDNSVMKWTNQTPRTKNNKVFLSAKHEVVNLAVLRRFSRRCDQ